MLSTIKQRLERDDEQGFTLIELMVVVLIIAILLAIAIPTFLGAKSSANARAAQSNARNALTAEQTVYTNNDQAFSNDVAASGVLLTAEPNLHWETTVPASTDPANSVSVVLGKSTNAADTVFIEALGKDGNCYVIQQVNDPQWAPTTGSAIGTGYGVEKGECSAPAATDGSQAPAGVATGHASATANVSAKGTFPSMFTQW